jgi:hypothetical protein
MAKLHWSEGRRPGDTLWVTLCGQLVVETATLPENVTCKRCKGKLLDIVPDTRAAEYVAAVFETRPEHRYDHSMFAEPQPLIDPISSLPVISRFTWNTVKDRRHWCGRCDVCIWFVHIEADAAARPWVKTHGISNYRWASVAHALEWYAQLRLDGYSMGTLGEVLDKLGRLGTKISTHGSAGQQKALEQAQDAVIVERAINACYLGPSKRLMSRAERLYCLLETTIRGTKSHIVARQIREANPYSGTVTGPVVAQIARDGRWTIYEILRQLDMIPPR